MNVDRFLQSESLLDAEQIAAVRRDGMRTDRAAIEAGVLDEQDLLRAAGRVFGMDVVDVRERPVDADVLSRFPTKALFHHAALPLERENGHVVVAVSDPFDAGGIDELAALSGFAVRAVLAPRRDVGDRIKELFGVGGDTVGELVRLSEDEDDAEYLQQLASEAGELAESASEPSVIRLVNELLVEAVEQRASDVHIEPAEAKHAFSSKRRGTSLTVRFRVDGVLRVQPVPPEINQFASAITTRLKIMAKLNIAEKRLPQDGRIAVRVAGREIDVRVSIIPMIHGEGVVMRLLDKQKMSFNFASVGMPEVVTRPFRQLCDMPHGIVLVTGPTGSGKSTTLYSALNEIKSPETKVITVEDPVEYHTEGISQIQVHPKIGLTFAAGLRSILRHDPDIILIGEIRDGETAEAATQAALTGHLVFSTLHTNDAPSAFPRLIDMGVEPYLVASTVEGVLAQRLVRRLCTHCKVPDETTDRPPDFNAAGATVFKPHGCRHCRESGYAGRVGIFELLITDATVRELTSERAPATAIARAAREAGMTTLRESGWQAAREGVTSVDEVLRVTKDGMLA